MRSTVAVAVACFIGGVSLADDARAAIRKQTNIPAQSLGAALQTFARERDVQVVYFSKSIDTLGTQGAVGELTIDEALGKLLSGSGLVYRYLDEHTITIVPRSNGTPASEPTTSQPSAEMRSEGEEGKFSWSRLRLAQTDSPSPSQAEGWDEGREQATAGEKSAQTAQSQKRTELEEIVVTGSRISRSAVAGAQNVKVYTRQEIQRSGQASVSEFLNTLPSMSLNSSERQLGSAATTPRLRGLPIGTTLVLINGQRVQVSGAQYALNFFDLSSIPLGAVERIDVLADGASAIYGSDAIAGVVNIILRSEIDDPLVTARYGSAEDISDIEYTAAWGKQWERGRISLFGSYQERGDLRLRDRELTADNDYRRYGGPNGNLPLCNPGNVFFPGGFSFNGQPAVPYAAVPNATGNPTLQDFAATAGTLNTCAIGSAGTLLAERERSGLLLSGSFDVSPALTLFTDVLYSRVKSNVPTVGVGFIGLPAAQLFSMGPNNPYNPFGRRVGVSYLFPGWESGNYSDTEFVRPMVGARGRFADSWSWQLAALQSEDKTDNLYSGQNLNNAAIQAAFDSSDPATAFNPFARSNPISPALLATLISDSPLKMRSTSQIANGFVRGALFDLPTGAIEAVVGAEYASDEIYYDFSTYPVAVRPNPAVTTRTRTARAAFSEIRVPLMSRDRLALTLVGRYDDYSDFGNSTNPQYALEWRPLSSLALRASYADAFKAPSLQALYELRQVRPNNTIVIDRNTGLNALVSTVVGGNPDLDPEIGRSKTLGLTYTSERVPGLSIASTYWSVSMQQAILPVGAQFMVDNAANYPGRVTRNAAGALTLVDVTRFNFGSVEVSGFDHQIAYRLPTSLGTWTASVGATQTQHYDARLVAGARATDRVSKATTDLIWAPRWKGTAVLGWQRNAFSTSLTGRYLDNYQDYNSTRQIGNFWLYDANLRYSFGQGRAFGRRLLDGGYLELGGVNIADKEPQYSNYSTQSGHDIAQADMRGRYWYAGVGLTF